MFHLQGNHGEDSDTNSEIQGSNKLSGHSIKLGEDLQNSKKKTGFIKLLTKRSRSTKINNVGLNEAVRIIIILGLFGIYYF